MRAGVKATKKKIIDRVFRPNSARIDGNQTVAVVVMTFWRAFAHFG
jgi:hypothetical protein